MSEEVKHTVGLLPCPFCGGEAETLFHQLEETYSAICTGVPKCQAAMQYVGVTEAEAIAAWNTRAALSQGDTP